LSDMGTNPSVQFVEATTLGKEDVVQNLDIAMRTHLFTCETCNF